MDNDERNHLGIKISAPRFDVSDAADYDLMFSSSFPSIAIAKQVTITLNPPDYEKPVEHGLGYPPFTIAWIKNPNTGKAYKVFDAPPFDDNFWYPTHWGFDPFEEIPLQMTLVAYNIDVSKSVQYPFIKQSAGRSSLYDPDFGIKVAKEGKSIQSADLRDFIIHSRTRSPLLLEVMAVVGQETTLTYQNPAGYLPWVYGFGGYEVGGFGSGKYAWQQALIGSQSYPRLQLNHTTGAYSVQAVMNFGGGRASLIALRDPLFAASSRSIQYNG